MIEEGSWQIIALQDNEDGKLFYRIMIEKPTKINCERFTENISISWRFADEGLPNVEMRDILSKFEELIDSLDDLEGNSFLTFVFSGRGKREWSYYAKDYNRFIEMLNMALASTPSLPIEIEHSSDPEWEYWRAVKEYVTNAE